MRRVFIAGVVLAAGLLAACSDKPEEEVLTLDTFVDEMIQSRNKRMAECVPAMSEYAIATDMKDTATIKAEQNQSLAGGRMAFEPAKAKSCLDKVKTASCAAVFDDESALADCEAAFVPKVAAGGNCYNSEECIDGWCDQDTCPGTCKAYAKEGDSCRGNFCLDSAGLFCDSDTDKCAKLKALGSDCIGDYECAGDYCNDEGKCGTKPAPGKAGAPCGECEAGLYCHMAPDADEGVCKPFLAAGATCGEHYTIASDQCGSTLTCAGFKQKPISEEVTDGKCTAWADIGAACTVPAEDAITNTGCKVGLICDKGTCRVPPTSGPCASENGGSKCDMRTAYCDPSKQCVPKKADGAACIDGDECKSGTCQKQKCGEACKP